MSVVFLIFKAFVRIFLLCTALGLDFLLLLLCALASLSLEPSVQDEVGLVHLLGKHHKWHHAVRKFLLLVQVVLDVLVRLSHFAGETLLVGIFLVEEGAHPQ